MIVWEKENLGKMVAEEVEGLTEVVVAVLKLGEEAKDETLKSDFLWVRKSF